MRASIAVASALAALALAPSAASAGTISYVGDTLTITAAPGELNGITLGGEQEGRLSISDANAHAFPADRCTQLDVDYPIQCEIPSAIRIDLGDGNDVVVVDHMVAGTPAVEVLGGAGNDNLKAIAGNTRLTLDGGPGADVLRSEGGNDVLRGGPDGDELIGGAGSDVLEGGDGADKLTGDVCEAPGADVLDGGAGLDTLTDWGDCGPNADRRPVTVTVNGIADDGRPGEGDDVRDLDALELFVPATVIGTDGDQSVAIYAPADREPSSIQGRGGSDDLRAGSGRETIDGGAGDDRIEGGFNHDTLTGGPGRDVIYGDSTSGNCGGYGQSCTIPFGNDTIDARDGEADQVDCGPGEDTATVDAVDTVAANCEQIDRGPGRAVVTPGAMTLDVKAPRRLRAMLRKGLVVRLAGFRPGPTLVTARVAGRVVAKARVRVAQGATATARLRFTRKARRNLSRRRSVVLVIGAGSITKTLTVKR
jgi:RTX calcium-binding nonapeptide repeat (4 copies)